MSTSLTEASYGHRFPSSVTEIEEEEEEEAGEVFEISETVESCSLFSVDVGRRPEEDCVYVAVGKSDSSMEAVSWTLSHCSASTLVYLIHVFPQIRHVPSPLGMLPRSQVSPAQLESYMAQERDKRRQLLQKFIDACNASKVKVDTILIESDMIAKAILDLIPILNIRQLVLGTNKSNLRKMRLRRGSGIADQVFQSAPDYCEIKVVCEGKEVIDQMTGSSSPRAEAASPKASRSSNSPKPSRLQHDSVKCICFGNKF